MSATSRAAGMALSKSSERRSAAQHGVSMLWRAADRAKPRLLALVRASLTASSSNAAGHSQQHELDFTRAQVEHLVVVAELWVERARAVGHQIVRRLRPQQQDVDAREVRAFLDDCDVHSPVRSGPRSPHVEGQKRAQTQCVHRAHAMCTAFTGRIGLRRIHRLDRWRRAHISAASTAARKPTGPAPLTTTRLATSTGGRSFQRPARKVMNDLVLCGTCEIVVACHKRHRELTRGYG